MRNFLIFVLLISIVLSFNACGGNNKSSDKTSINNSRVIENENNANKINGKITAASPYREGLAFVNLDHNKEKAYCIDKHGNIVFVLENGAATSINGTIYAEFKNGYAIINSGGAICNTKGEITYAKDVGATEFLGVAFNGGYIVAVKETADYSSAKIEMGVMNTAFEWIVQPSEVIYNELSENLWVSTALGAYSYFANDITYFEGCEKFLNVKTGEISDTTDVKFPSENWESEGFVFKSPNGDTMLDLNNINNIYQLGNNYKNGKVPVNFYNEQVDKHYWTLINEKGEFLFEPIETELASVSFDGDNVLLFDTTDKKLNCFNSNGELLGELSGVDFTGSEISDGVILLKSGKKCFYYNTDFSPLF